MRLPFATAYGVERSRPLSVSRVLNLHAHQPPPDAKTPVALYASPGLAPLGDAIDAAPTRGMCTMQDILYVVAGTSLYRVNAAGSATTIGTVLGDGPVFMVTNGTQIFICNTDNQGYIATVATVAEIADTDFPGASSVTYVDGYFVFSQPGSGQFWITSLLDGTAIDALDFASAEGDPDLLTRVFADHRELWLFGQRTIEVWSNTGAADFPFERVNGAIITHGTEAPHSVAALDNSIFWLAEDGIVYRANGYTPARVSTHGIELLISGMPNKTDARAFAYTDEGHGFYVLTFPNQATIVYDVATGLWHERQTTGRMDWAVTGYAKCYDRHLTGGFTNGKVYAIDRALLTEDGASIRRQAVTPTIWAETQRFTTSRIQVDFEMGTGIPQQAVNPNGLSDSEDLTQATWTKHGVTISSDALAISSVDGATFADRVIESATTDFHFVEQVFAKPSGPTDFVFSAYLKGSGRNAQFSVASGFGTGWIIGIDLTTGEIVASVNGGGTLIYQKVSIVDAENSIFRAELGVGISDASSQLICEFLCRTSGGSINYAGDGSSGLYVFGLKLEQAAEATPAYAQTPVAPQAMLDWSDDGGKTWSNEHWRSIGLVGKYKDRAQWNRLGQARQRVYRVTVSDPVIVSIMGMYGEISGGSI